MTEDNNFKTDVNMRNPQLGAISISVGIIVLGIGMMVFPGIIGMDGFNGGFALSFFGGFVTIIGIIAVIMFARLARLFSNMMTKENIIAHWIYSQEDWKQYTEEEHKSDAKDKRYLFILVAAISIIVGVVMGIMYPDDMLVIFYIILGIIVVIGITAFLSVLSPYRWNKKHLGDVFIAKDGVYLNRRLHIWKGLGAKLEGVKIEGETNSLPRIIVRYSALNTTMRNYYTVRIPIPRGHQGEAENIVKQIQSSQR